jgi:hypothetical protein
MKRLHRAMLRAILRSAALLVPGEDRAEWLAEWNGELWHVTSRPIRFCLGAYLDAFWLMRNRPDSISTRSFALESPVHCLLPALYPDSQAITIIYDVPFERYQALAGRVPAATFYRPTVMNLRQQSLNVALASPNLFSFLGWDTHFAGPQLVLSHTAWGKYFHADPRVVGRIVEFAGRQVRVSAVIPGGAWRPPGRFDAWLFDGAALSPRTPVVVLAQLHNSAAGRQGSIVLPGGEGRFPCAALDREPFLIPSLAMMLLAALLVFGTTRLTLGEYPPGRYRRRWIFFTLKIALLLPIVLCGSLDLGALLTVGNAPHGMLFGSFFAIRWALRDQRNRCPVCLRLLSSPTRIGAAAQTFLEWYGTELVCSRGHGLLYVPEIPTSSYWAHRWQYLDPSWNCLFSYPGAPRVRSRYG